MSSPSFLKLSQLLDYVSQAVSVLAETPAWVACEVLNISGHPHRYLELVEYDDNRREVAKTRGMIWKSDLGLLDRFTKSTGLQVTSGMKILVKAVPGFHPVYGLALTISDIDPTYTLGDMEAKVKMIRDHLIEKNWFDMNRGKAQPRDFTRVAVISPKEAAGLGDFRVDADKLHKANLCHFSYYPCGFQGKAVADNLVEQMIKVNEDHKLSPFDAVILIRGGGDKAGLYQLNERRLAVAVCRFPIPVMVGIGHERDKVFIDEVACLRFATPSLLISHIKQRIVSNAKQAEIDFQNIRRQAGLLLEKADKQATAHYYALRQSSNERLTSIQRQADIQIDVLKQHARSLLDQQDSQADLLRMTLVQQAHNKLGAIEQQANLLISDIMSANPLAILGRGYGYIQKGTVVVTQPNQIGVGDSVKVVLKSFSFNAQVQQIHE